MAEEKKQEEEQVKPAIVTEGKLYPDVKPGCMVKVHEKITDVNTRGEEKQRIQVFEGMVIQRKHGAGISATITVRKVSNGVGVEKVYPLASPVVVKVEVVRRYKVRRAKLSFLRNYFKKLREIKD